MSKEGWCVELGQEGVAESGGDCLKYLKRGWNREKGRGNKDFKKGWQAGARDGSLKKGGMEPPYELCLFSKIRNGNIRATCEIWSKLTKKKLNFFKIN